jgi:hypothetical protein
MNNELSLLEFIQRQLSQEEQNYVTALRNDSASIELTEIESEIKYLESCLIIVRRSLIPSHNGIPVKD